MQRAGWFWPTPLLSAVEYGPDLIVDLATLTGACKVALGREDRGS